MVFHGRSNEPGCLRSFNEKASTTRDGGTVSTIKIMIGCPAPHVFDIGRGGARQMDKAPSSLALIGGATAISLNLAACRATNSEVSVEEANIAGVGSGNINFHL